MMVDSAAIIDSTSSTKHDRSRMRAWRLNSYYDHRDRDRDTNGSNTDTRLSLNESIRIPSLDRPDDVLIRVHAASLNPIDVQMTGGFGRAVIGAMRRFDQRWHTDDQQIEELPLTLGRDCSGVVADAGRNVTRFKPGDQVWCAIPASRQGAFCEYVLAKECGVSMKPSNLNHVEAASLPYVACTVGSALRYAARMTPANSRGSNALIFGAAGGIGTFAVQLLHAWNCAGITAMCRPDAFDLVSKLGAGKAIDYRAPDAWTVLCQSGAFDVILDPIFDSFSRRSTALLKHWSGSTYVSITNPLLDDCDRRGLILGSLTSAGTFINEFVQCLGSGRVYTWAYVVPDGGWLEKVAAMVENGKLRPVVERVYPFDQLPAAMDKLAGGGARGKIVLQVVPD